MPDDLTAAQARLNRARDKQRRAALGPPLATTDGDLDMLSTVYPADMLAVEAFIRDNAGQVGVDLFRATREDQRV